MPRTLVVAALVGAVLAAGWDAAAVRVPGGGKARTDCYAQFEIGATAPSPDVAECTDGDPRCDRDGERNGSCRFAVALCLNQGGDPACVPPGRLSRVRLPRHGPAAGLAVPPLAGAGCGEARETDVPVRRARTLRVTAIAPGRPRRDADAVRIACRTSPICADCAGNAAGGPDALVVTVREDGTDLDMGWSGIFHNFPVPSGVLLHLCLADCDGAADVECAATGLPGYCALEDATFGPPLPIVAAGTPLCLVNRFAPGSVSGTANVATGAVEATIGLLADVFVTEATRVCPRCVNGACDGGARRGRPCQVDGTVIVQNSLLANKTFDLSRDCPPDGDVVSTLALSLPLTTGRRDTPGTGGSKPCRDGEASGVPVKDNGCPGGECGVACAPGSETCVERVPDPSDPAGTICRDVKGGLSQTCCAGDPRLSCFPTQPGGPGLVRTGRAVPPAPALPDPSYPKTAEGGALVATFCQAATGFSGIDTFAGLPAPGALVLSTRTDWLGR